jgi:hypothetical protein
VLRSHTTHNPLDETMSHCRISRIPLQPTQTLQNGGSTNFTTSSMANPMEKKRTWIKEVIHERRLGLNWEGLLEGCRSGVNPTLGPLPTSPIYLLIIVDCPRTYSGGL